MSRKLNVDKAVFGKRLKMLMSNFGETTYSMSKKFNLSPPSISRYTRGEMVPKITTVKAMASYFDVNAEWLMGRDASMYATEIIDDPSLETGGDITLSVFKNIRYDRPIFSNEKTGSSLSLPGKLLTQWGSAFALEISDDSMAPTLKTGDHVVIKLNTFLKSGDLTALHINHKDLVIRKVIFKNYQLILQPHNPAFPVEIYDLHRDNVQVIGSVVYLRRVYEHFFE